MTAPAIVEAKTTALAATPTGRMAVADIIGHVALVQEVMRAVMKGPSKEHPQGVHYGIIPGTDKPTLLKAGAEVLCMAFRIADSYAVEDLSDANTVRYRVTCTGTHQITGHILGTGMGEASSGEEKYKWRKAYKDEFEATPPNLRREKKGWDKQKRESYSIMQVRTEPADLANTILKMANKRAKMAMVLNVTAASDCFSQDLEDMDEALRDHLTRHAEGAPPPPDPPAQKVWPEEDFSKQFARWSKAVSAGLKTVDEILTMARTKGALTPEQEAKIRALVQGPAQPAGDDIVMTYAQVADRLTKADTLERLDEAAGLIQAVAGAAQQAELQSLYETRRGALG